MADKKPVMVQVYKDRAHSITREEAVRFRDQLDAGMKPSLAVKELFKIHPDMDADAVIDIMRFAYPDADMDSRFRMPLLDTNYPQSLPKFFSDDDFDASVAKLLVNGLMFSVPGELVCQFKDSLEAGTKPSQALGALKTQFPEVDSKLTLDLLRYCYADKLLVKDTARPLLDSGYPNCDPNVFSDDDFDTLVAKLVSTGIPIKVNSADTEQ